MAIGATALYKLSNLVGRWPEGAEYAGQLRLIAHVELAVVAVVILYVLVLYLKRLPEFLRA